MGIVIVFTLSGYGEILKSVNISFSSLIAMGLLPFSVDPSGSHTAKTQ